MQINRFARRTAVGVATRYGSGIVKLVSETVKRWDATTVTGRIENAVGRDSRAKKQQQQLPRQRQLFCIIMELKSLQI